MPACVSCMCICACVSLCSGVTDTLCTTLRIVFPWREGGCATLVAFLGKTWPNPGVKQGTGHSLTSGEFTSAHNNTKSIAHSRKSNISVIPDTPRPGCFWGGAVVVVSTAALHSVMTDNVLLLKSVSWCANGLFKIQISFVNQAQMFSSTYIMYLLYHEKTWRVLSLLNPLVCRV